MQRRAFILQNAAPGVSEAPDPLEERPEAITEISAPTLLMVGEHDIPDFIGAAEAMAKAIPHAHTC